MVTSLSRPSPNRATLQAGCQFLERTAVYVTGQFGTFDFNPAPTATQAGTLRARHPSPEQPRAIADPRLEVNKAPMR